VRDEYIFTLTLLYYPFHTHSSEEFWESNRRLLLSYILSPSHILFNPYIAVSSPFIIIKRNLESENIGLIPGTTFIQAIEF
jgi:hypothetical protein